MSELDKLGADLAQGWRPQEGDKLVGVVVDLALGWSDYSSGNYPIITIHDDEKDEDVAVHCFHYVLDKKVKELKPEVGERVGVVYKGTVPSKDGKRTISVYDFRVEGRGAKIWDAPQPTPEPANVPTRGDLEEDIPY
jgi:hypothetical protein